MASTPKKKRPKSDTKNPKITNSNPSKSSCSSSYNFLPEPSPNILPSKSDFFRIIAVVAMAALVALVCNFVSTILNRSDKPFCDGNVEFDDSFSDFCEPCPSNGVCYEGKLECFHGYRRHGKSCIEDGGINELAKKLVKLVEVHACNAYSQYLCEGAGFVWAQDDELWRYLDDLKQKENCGSDDAYVLAKQRAMGNIEKLMESRENSHGVTEMKCPDFLVERYKPRTCKMRLWIVEHTLILVQICVLILGCTLILLKLWRRHILSVRAEELYGKICDILEENALHSRSVNGEVEPWVVSSLLRDHLLFPRERRNPLLWNKVEELVQEDTRLIRYPKMVKGESKVVWEWQAAFAMSLDEGVNWFKRLDDFLLDGTPVYVEGSLSSLSKRKKSEHAMSGSTNVQSPQYRWKVKPGKSGNDDEDYEGVARLAGCRESPAIERKEEELEIS